MKYLISLGYFSLIMFSLLFIYTILSYFDLLSNNILCIILYIIPFISILYSSYRLGKSSLNKGYLEGIKFGLIIIFIFIIISLLFDSINIKSFLYYLILIISSSLGSMIGINRKRVSN